MLTKTRRFGRVPIQQTSGNPAMSDTSKELTYRTLVTGSAGLVGLALDTQVHDVVPAFVNTSHSRIRGNMVIKIKCPKSFE